MQFKVFALAAAIVAGAAAAPGPAAAASLPGVQSPQSVIEPGAMVEKVRRRGHRHHHFRHRHFRHRHFYRPRPFFYTRCTRVRRACAAYWDWGTWEYDRCLRRRGC